MSEPREDQPIDDLAAAGKALQELLEPARRRIWVHAHCRLLMALPEVDLGPAMSRVGRRTRHSDLRLLIDDDLALKRGLPLLARTVTRLTTAISVRCLSPEKDSPATLLLVVDHEAWLYLVQHKGRIAMKLGAHDRPGNRIAAEDFAENWAVGSESLELRKLNL